MLTPDTVLQGRYRIFQLIGRGGMGAVYEATDLRLGNTVALKETLVEDDLLRKAFEGEARTLARLHHPALPDVSDHFIEGTGQYLVMRYIAGEDLGTQLEQRGGDPFPIGKVKEWGDQLLDALMYLHGHEPPIVHRDIKPQNLKVLPRGEIVLLDFGLAKGGYSGTTRVTTGGRSLYGYTPQYAPLEQVRGSGTDARSDLYSLAATMYHLMTGTIPPDALNRASAMVTGAPDPLLPAHQLNPKISQALSDVLARAMAQNPNDRPSSAAAMRALLKESERPNALPATVPVVVPPPLAPAVPVGAAATVPPRPPLPLRVPAIPPDAAPAPGPVRRALPLIPLALGALLLLLVMLGVVVMQLMKGNDASTAGTTPASVTVAAIAAVRSPTAAATSNSGAARTVTVTEQSESTTDSPSATPDAPSTSTVPSGSGGSGVTATTTSPSSSQPPVAPASATRTATAPVAATRTPTAPVPTRTPTSAPPTATSTPIPPTFTSTAVPPTITPTAAPVGCQEAPAPTFAAAANEFKSTLGCPTAPPFVIPTIGEQFFEGGHMFWFSHSNRMVAVYDRSISSGSTLYSGGWQTNSAWVWDGSFPNGTGLVPPPGRLEPTRGFGYVWRNFLNAQDGPLGWALDVEYGFDNTGRLQQFENGFIFQGSDPAIYVFMDSGFARR